MCVCGENESKQLLVNDKETIACAMLYLGILYPFFKLNRICSVNEKISTRVSIERSEAFDLLSTCTTAPLTLVLAS